MIAQYRPKPVVQGEEADGSRCHGKKHAAGGSGTNEHPSQMNAAMPAAGMANAQPK